MKVLWFSNSILANSKSNATGTWLQTMSEALTRHGIQIINITQSSSVSDIKYLEDGLIKQWVLPVYKLTNNGLPRAEVINFIVSIADSTKPDIIHVWGTEFYWGLLTARGYIRGKVILEIEGIMASCVDVFYGGLSNKEIFSTFGIKEILSFKRSIVGRKREFQIWGEKEIEMLRSHKYISTQSDWVRNWIKPYTENAVIFNTGLIIRSVFYTSPSWRFRNTNTKQIFAMSSGDDTYKGLHILIKSLAFVKMKYHDIKLVIAGDYGQKLSFYRKPGYFKYLHKLIKRLHLIENVTFTGPLTADEIAREMLKSDVMVQSSYVESYSMALAEGMAIGIPLVVSYAGAMPELAKDGESALFFPCGDYSQCASKIIQILGSKSLSERLSVNAITMAKDRNTSEKVVELQLYIYKKMVKQNGNSSFI